MNGYAIQPGLRLAIMLTARMLSTTSALWLRTSMNEVTTPRSGLDLDGTASWMLTRTDRVSPGRTGRTQRNSSTPGEARLAHLVR